MGTYKNAVKHEVDRLETAGLVSSRHVGRSRLVSVSADEPVRSILLDLVLHTYGPLHVIGEELSSVAGITEAFIYGSWAARYAREPGPTPGDIDVLVVGDPDRDDLFEAVGRGNGPTGQGGERPRRDGSELGLSRRAQFLAAVRESPLAAVPRWHGGSPSGEAS